MNNIFQRIKRIIKSNLIDLSISKEFELVDVDDSENLKKQIEDALKNNPASAKGERAATQDEELFWAYRILGVTADSSLEEIKKAFKSMVRQYHPDLVQNLGSEIQELANRKLQELNRAYKIILKHRNY